MARPIGYRVSMSRRLAAPRWILRRAKFRINAKGASVIVSAIDLRLSTGNRRQSRSVAVLRECEGPRPGAMVARDSVAPSHFLRRRSAEFIFATNPGRTSGDAEVCGLTRGKLKNRNAEGAAQTNPANCHIALAFI